jgi:DNA-binding GntR family transcriptional regulator
MPKEASTSESLEMPGLPGAGSLSDQITDVLRSEIMERRLAPGEKLNPDVLAQHFGVSRIPVREALRSLHVEGWVHIEPRRSARVRQHDEAEFHALFEARAFIEGQVARLAARRRTDEQLDVLKELLTLGWTAVHMDDRSALGRLNSTFHNHVAQCAANPVLAEVSEQLGLTVRWYYSAVRDERAEQSMLEHDEITAAIADQDEDRAAEIVQLHVEETKAAVARTIGQNEDGSA